MGWGGRVFTLGRTRVFTLGSLGHSPYLHPLDRHGILKGLLVGIGSQVGGSPPPEHLSPSPLLSFPKLLRLKGLKVLDKRGRFRVIWLPFFSTVCGSSPERPLRGNGNGVRSPVFRGFPLAFLRSPLRGAGCGADRTQEHEDHHHHDSDHHE